MGWTTSSSWESKSDTVDSIKIGYEKTPHLHIEKQAIKGKYLWLLVKNSLEDHNHLFVTSYLVTKCDGEWTYKDVGFDSDFSCPKSFFEAIKKTEQPLTERETRWCEKLETRENKLTAKLSEGAKIKLYGNIYNFIKQVKPKGKWLVGSPSEPGVYEVTPKQIMDDVVLL